ncbi:uncharacterized protein DNG_08357 [Cephalotrichum gorgonifer]|uniref:Uncharacterized protein n=1 Tax=Cephalotrichum gorgonifer TaxID=2041049 RepID=A0AAE8SYA0_9PEZI|nr:uncharacterized protein DNG_08357 [Cephalotrichum gorgonifer]
MARILGVCARLPRLGTRRISFILIGISLFAVLSLIFTLPDALPDGPSLSRYTDHKFSVPIPDLKNIKNPFSTGSILNPFRHPPHPPPRQQNDTFEESSWWADWKWLVPFSSSFTLDEERSLLPPLIARPPVYCYYDDTGKKDSETKDAESELLLTWRMAWWAKGFKPIILSAAEAMNNPNYETLQRVEIDPAVKAELMRWLAFENMGGGIMSQSTLIPMGPYEDPLLVFLRRGEYPALTRWKELDTGLFVGTKEFVSSFVKSLFDSDKDELEKAKDLFSLVPQATFEMDAAPKSLAYYDEARLKKDYLKVTEEISANRAQGLLSLNKLMNAHLHVMWQNVFHDGIAVLKPLPEHSTHIVADAWELAHLLAECPDSPMPESCPPNYPKCNPCKAGQVKVTTPEAYSNASTLFTIGTVPHPYTLATLHNLVDTVDVNWIRRHMNPRDPWVIAVTKDTIGKEQGSGPRVKHIKQAIAGDPASPARSIWLTAEKEPPTDLYWNFGFVLPQNSTVGPEGTEDEDSTPVEIAKEAEILAKAVQFGTSSKAEDVKLRNTIEAWNLADTEAWKFARAFLSRRTMVRKAWEKEEERYIDGAGSEKGRHTWNRWLDRLEDKLDRRT